MWMKKWILVMTTQKVSGSDKEAKKKKTTKELNRVAVNMLVHIKNQIPDL